MTSPDEYFPDTAINAAPGFSAYAGTTREDYEDALAEQWNGFLGPCSAICMLMREIPLFGDFVNIGQSTTGGTGSMACNALTGGSTWTTDVATEVTGASYEGASPTAGEAKDTIVTYDLNTVKNGNSILALSPSGVVDVNGLPRGNNLLSNPVFNWAGVMGTQTPFKPGNGWEYDDTDGEIGLGCAKVTADGHVNELVSNQISVHEGDHFQFAVSAKWAGLEYTGTNPIIVGVTEYLDNSEVGDVDITGIETPAADEPDWPTGGGDGVIGALYTVPADVDEIRLRLKIGSNLTAGVVKWDNAGALKTDGIRDDAVPGIGTTVDNITNAFTGWTSSGHSHDEAATALTAQSSATTSNAAQIAALWSVTSAAPGVMDDFDRAVDYDDIGANWDENYGSGTGHWFLSSFNADWSPNGTGTRESLCRFVGTDAVSGTDYQTTTVVLASAPGWDGATNYGNNDVIGRCDATEENYIRFRVCLTGEWWLHKIVSGTATQMATGTGVAPAAGTTLVLICGDKANTVPRHFTCRINNQSVYTGDGDGDTTSAYGADYRYRGFGGLAEGDVFFQLGNPGGVTAWISQDTP